MEWENNLNSVGRVKEMLIDGVGVEERSRTTQGCLVSSHWKDRGAINLDGEVGEEAVLGGRSGAV